MKERVYLDWNATTPLRLDARQAIIETLDIIGNPSSVHGEGRQARRILENARSAVAAALGADPGEVVFTSGATEANMLALTPGVRRQASPPTGRLIVSAIEHASVLAGGRFARDQIERAPVNASGIVDLDWLREALDRKPVALVSIMLANNETGAIQPIAAVADMVHAAGGVLHVDAVAAVGKLSINFSEMGADLLSISAHKIGGPKGVGALIVADRVLGLESELRGGGQEKGRRGGTENLPGIAGFGAAARASADDLESDAAHGARLRQRLEAGLKAAADNVIIFSEDVPRLPNTTLFTVPGLRAETAVIGFDLEGIAVSSGSACSSGKVQPSHVLQAMHAAPDIARGGVRISLGWTTAESDIDQALGAWRKLTKSLGKKKDETVLERF